MYIFKNSFNATTHYCTGFKEDNQNAILTAFSIFLIGDDSQGS